jgi:signal transduction histidine kinase/DNA-binding response OmpR family regulator
VTTRHYSPALLLRALTRASALLAEGPPEERLVESFARTAAEAVGADLAAVYLLADQPDAPPAWRLAGQVGGNSHDLAALPTSLAARDGLLALLFEQSRELHEADLRTGLDHLLLVRSVVGIPVRRRGKRQIGALLLGAYERDAFDETALATLRSMSQLLGVGLDNARLSVGVRRERRPFVESQATLGTVLESVGSGVCVVELDGTVRVANKAFRDLFGVVGPMDGLLEEQVFTAASLKPAGWDEFLERLRNVRARPSEVDESEWELAAEVPRIVKRYSAPVSSIAGEVVGRVNVYTDVTESRRLYTQLLNSEKLRAIGEMASGVAHDFNNLLASILGQVELLHPDELAPSTRQAIATIKQSALDGARIVRNLQGLARPRVETPSTSADLNEAVLAALEMARPRFASGTLHGRGAIDVRTNLASGVLSRVAIDSAELREVLLNLLFNAADAMPRGGLIEISTAPGPKPKTADLVVSDTGHGIPASVRARIFEPFFSTKGPKGSGLGLAVAYSVITRRGGQIGVESAPDRGTTFTINLPFVPIGAPAVAGSTLQVGPEKPSEPPPPPKPLGAALRGASILVADDEPGLVGIVRALMERSGAGVTIAHGGRAALEALESARTRFDVVITDLDMPEVDGWAVASTVRRLSPGTHVVMLTGWAGELAPDDARQRGVDVVLAKPCSRPELEAAIGSLLTPKPATAFEVLLVDDEAAFAHALRDMLTLQGHRVTVVDSAAAAMQTVSTQAFDVVLTDYSLGEVTGAELAEQLADREVPAFVVLVTGYATEIDDPSLLSRGVNAVLPKPCRGDDVRAVLSRVTRRVS